MFLENKHRNFMDVLYKKESYDVIGAAMEVHRTLGSGFTEYVYQDALEQEFKLRNIPYEREKHMIVTYKGVALQHEYIVDFLCYDNIIVELKASKELCKEHEAQVINYLKVSSIKFGLLINFGELSLHYKRLVRL